VKVNDFNNWAETYDLIYGSYSEDIPFYTKAAREAGGKVLEVACGTGRVYLELLKAGVDAYGLDIAGKELDVLRKKAAALNLKPQVEIGDMRDFKLKHKFALIIIPFRAFLHNLTTEDQLNTLRTCRRHLSPGGKLMLNFFLPNPEVIVTNYGKENATPIDSSEDRLERVTNSNYVDEAEQIIEVRDQLRRDGVTFWKDTFRIAFIYKREFELLLRLSKFSRWQVYGGFDFQPLTSYRQEMVWVIEK
jgi:SAM-dependent methyltransferase